MKQKETFVGFDFETIWEIQTGEAYPFPTLRSLPHYIIEDAENTIEFAGGNGAPYNPYLISTKEHLNNVRNYLDAHFKMAADITFTEADFAEGGTFYNDGQGWEPIGSSVETFFFGSFDGNGHTITGLVCHRSGSDEVCAGLFGYNQGHIQNLGMVEGDVSATSTSSYAHTYAHAYAGGIAGRNIGTISNCYNTGNVTASATSTSPSTSISSYAYVGGIAGGNDGTISNCYNTGSVTASAASASTSPSISSYAYVGGIAGGNDGTISNCYNTGSLSATATSSSSHACSYAGGIAGDCGSGTTIRNCYNTGSVSATVTSSSAYTRAYAGGIAGRNGGTISNCYNTDSVASFDYAGGIAGGNYGGTISNCYNTGNVTAAWWAVGIAGDNYDSTITNCYYLDTATVGMGSRGGTSTDTSIRCTVEQMKQEETFIGFDFETIWEIQTGEAYPFPTLRSLPYCIIEDEENTVEFAGGNGAPYNPYLISTKEHLNNVRNYLDAHFKMAADITFTEVDFAKDGAFYNRGQGWEPIGADSSHPFFGSFDGNGHTITGLICHRSGSDSVYAGLFGYNQGHIQNLGMVKGDVSATANSPYAYAGGVAGENSGAISNCYNTGSVSATSSYAYTDAHAYVGGIAGGNDGTIRNCYNTGSVSATATSSSSSSHAYAGGIAGGNDGTISNCYNTGSVSATATSSYYGSARTYAGGIAGNKYGGTISDCYYLDTAAKGVGDASTDTSVRCTVEQMKQKETFIGFDFETIWEIQTGEAYPFPTLRSLPYYIIEDEENTNEFAGGNGTPYNPYLIFTKEHLNNVRNYLDAHFKMMTDIVFTEADFAEGGAFYNRGQGWKPIGTDSSHPFFGSFDGDGYTIAGLVCHRSDSRSVYAGLFGYNQGHIQNLGMVKGDVSATSSSISSYAYAGGIAGKNSGAISNCYNTGSVSATSTATSTSSYAYAGGIAGENSGTIRNCYNTGSVPATSTSTSTSSSSYAHAYAGGIAGSNSGTISNCYNTGSVSAASTSSYAHTYANASAGGIAGRNVGTINNCYNTGSVTKSAYAGGIAGDNVYSGTISNCYNTGSVSATSSRASAYAGGIAGDNDYSGTISDCYNTGSVSATSSRASAYAGGIVGYNDAGGTISDCYYLDTAAKGVGSSSDTSTDTSIRCTAEQMKQKDTFIGFDFDTVWEIDSYRVYPYPQLKSNRQEPIQSIELLTKPDHSIQTIEGLLPELSGVTVKIVYEDGFEIIIEATTKMLSQLNVSQLGVQTIHLTYGGQTTTETIDIKVLPPAPMLSEKTDTTVTLKAVAGYEYSKDGVTWQDSPTFVGLNPDTEYRFYQRVKETDTQYASPSSTALTVKTEPEYIIGDLDGNNTVTDADAVYLLYHTLLPELYPINQSADYNGDGKVTDADAIYLLYHTLLPDLYPLH